MSACPAAAEMRAPTDAPAPTVKADESTAPPPVATFADAAFEAEEIESIRASLLTWYDAHHRVLPWRRNPHSRLPPAAAAANGGGAPLDTPTQQFMYGVWVCEIMAQQTQLDRVVKYWTEWMQKWPTVDALAAATEDDVRAAWAGLGYYRRAAFLLKGARYVAGELKGVFPTDVAGLSKIPGVGPYTAAAVASIGAGTRAAVVDGNVVRVLSRLRAVGGDPKSTAAAKAHARLADSLVDDARPGDFNQAVMELGATVCTGGAVKPACGRCPVAAVCAARTREVAGVGAATDFPHAAPKAAKREETVDVCVVEAGGRVLLQRRPEGGLLAGLWEFPSVAVPAASVADAARRRAAVDAHVARLVGRSINGASAVKGEDGGGGGSVPATPLRRAAVGEITHIFSHIRMALAVEHVRLPPPLAHEETAFFAPRAADADGGVPETRWVGVGAMATERVSSSVAKCWRLVASGGGSAATSSKRAAAPAAAGGQSIKKFFTAAVKKEDVKQT